MKTILLILQIIVSVTLVFLVTIQSKGGGLGSSFGANQTLYSKRRGVEKIVFNFTLILVFLFLTLSIANLLL